MNNRFQILVGALVGLSAGFLIPAVSGSTTKRALLVGVALLGLITLAVSQYRELICIAAVIFLIPLNINYFLFGLYAPHIGGATGLYLVPLDFPLAFLYVHWFVSAALRHSRFRSGPMPRAVVYFLPFFTVAVLSVLYARNSAWASYELLRWVRFLLLLIYFSRLNTPAGLNVALASLAGAAVFQGVLATAQTAFRSNFGMDRLGVVGKGSQDVFVEQLASAGTMVRGAGSTGHPNVLAPFLVLTVYIYFLFALTESRLSRKLFWALAGLITVAGLIATLSRSSWISFAISGAIALSLAVSSKLLSFNRALRIVVASLILAAACVSPFIGKLRERWKVGFSEAIEFRQNLNRTALRMISDRPFLGVGLNNFTIVYPNYDPENAEKLETEWGALPVVHNLYLLVWSELGAIGLLCLFAFWAGIYRYCFSFLRQLPEVGQAFLVGTISGITGLLISDISSFAFWTEVIMYTSAVLLGLAEVIRRRESAGGAASMLHAGELS